MKLNIATFNAENLDYSEVKDSEFQIRRDVLVPQLNRLNADILCLQEIHAQKNTDGEYELSALNKLLKGTKYEKYEMATTINKSTGQPYNQRNLIVLSKYTISEYAEYKHEFAQAPKYGIITGTDTVMPADKITWERPILHVQIKIENEIYHVINLHLKSKLATDIKGQKVDSYTWKTAAGWAEGSFISTIRRTGQALETRILIDTIFDDNPNANIIVAGDFNSDYNEEAVEAILGRTENTGNPALNSRVLIPCELSVAEPARFSLFHHGKKNMLDHIIISKKLINFYKGCEIHNEVVKDESLAFFTDLKFPESDHAPIVARFEV